MRMLFALDTTRVCILSALLLPALVTCTLFLESESLRDADSALVPTSDIPDVASTVDRERIELRQAPAVAITTLPVARVPQGLVPTGPATPAPVTAPTPIVNPPLDPVPPPANVSPVAAPFSNVAFVTVQWVETFIGGTYSTWWPHTISIDFKPQQTIAPLPGNGQIGMGMLTGKTGQTQTVVMDAAPSHGLGGWAKGVAAVAGVGIMGMF